MACRGGSWLSDVRNPKANDPPPAKIPEHIQARIAALGLHPLELPLLDSVI